MEPRSYFDPPSEREWTIEEREEFFAGQDAVTGLLNGTAVNNVPFRPNSSIHYYGNELAFSMSKGLDCFLYWLPEWKGIHITHIVPPAQGWPIAAYCPTCRETTFILSPWAAKPKDGDYFKMNDTCISKGLSGKHVLEIFHSNKN
jgi:hypothetical protein